MKGWPVLQWDNSDLTLLVDFYSCTCEHGLKHEYKIICFAIGAILAKQQGTYANVFNPVQNRILMAH